MKPAIMLILHRALLVGTGVNNYHGMYMVQH